MTTLQIMQELKQEGKEKQENKEVGGSGKGGNAEGGVDTEMAGVWVWEALFCSTFYFTNLFSITSIITRIEIA